MKIVLKGWKQALGLLMFIGFMTMYFIQLNSLEKLIGQVKRNVYQNGVLYEANREPVEGISRYEKNQVIAYFMGPLTYDVVLNSNFISADSYNYMEFNFEDIDHLQYQLEYHYKANGEIDYLDFEPI